VILDISHPVPALLAEAAQSVGALTKKTTTKKGAGMRNWKYASLLTTALLASLPALAQPPASTPAQPKFPTPPPAVTAENSVIGPDYANAPESVAVPGVPQGDIREFILYSEDSKIYPGIVRAQDMQRDARGNYFVPAGTSLFQAGPL